MPSHSGGGAKKSNALKPLTQAQKDKINNMKGSNKEKAKMRMEVMRGKKKL